MKNIISNFIKGILAGLAIGLGGFLYVICVHYIPGAEFSKSIGSTLFAVGLFLVCTFSLSLYTGKIGLIFEEKKDKDFIIALPVMLIGNAVGAFGLGYLMYAIFQNHEVMNTVITKVCEPRTNLVSFDNYLGLMIKSLLCGVCVYLAVKAFSLNRLKPIGTLLLVFFVFVFVYSGFQHCVANMFYFGFGNHILPETFINLALCILFNSLGPIFPVLLSKLFLNKNEKEIIKDGKEEESE